MNKIIGCIVTKNEEEYIRVALSGMSFMDKVYVIDNGSTDKTLDIAKKFPNVLIKKVSIDLPHSVGTQRNYVLDYIKDPDCWIYFSDGDEYITQDLAEEILSSLDNEFDAYQVPRLNYFLGKALRHGGWYPDYQLRLIKKKCLVKWVQGPLDLPPVIKYPSHKYLIDKKSGPHDKPLIKDNCRVGRLSSHYLHFNHRSINSMMTKTTRFYDSEVNYLCEMGSLKEPSGLRLLLVPIREFIRRYVIRLGFLDGKVGIIESLYQAFSLFIFECRKWEVSQNPPISESYEMYKERCIKNQKIS